MTEYQSAQLDEFLEALGLSDDDLALDDRSDSVQVGYWVHRDTAEILDEIGAAVGLRGRAAVARLILLSYLKNNDLPEPERRRRKRVIR